MSTVDKMLIKGIRSFDPENKNVITFLKPLTLIVGPNGAGKTTIIECLKLSCTGELPPNARSGHSFIHDPKVAGETETKAQIKLRFRTAAGKDVVCIRSFQLTQKASKMEYKAIESVLQTINPHNGEKVCLSYRCADMDREIPALMGVSKAILENVIFVHQDDANWPLQDPSTLKKKFDDIFSATRYTKALEVIKKLHKDQAQEIKTYKLKLDNLQILKDAAYKLKESISQDEERTTSVKIQIQDLEKNIEIINASIRKEEMTLKELRELKEQISNKTAERSVLFRKQQEQYGALSEENEDTDDELTEWKTRFEEKIALLESKIRKLARDDQDIENSCLFLKRAIDEHGEEINRLQIDAGVHESMKRERDSTLQKLIASYNLGPVAASPFTEENALSLTNRLKKRAADLEIDFQDKKKSNESVLKAAWDEYVAANDRWKDMEAQKHVKVDIKNGLINRIRQKEEERESFERQITTFNLSRIDDREKSLHNEVERKSNQIDEREFQHAIEKKQSEIYNIDPKIKALNRERDLLAGDSEDRAKLSLLKDGLENRKKWHKKIIDEHKHKIRELLKGRLPLEKDLKKEISQVHSKLTMEFDDLSSKSREAEKEVNKLQMRVLDVQNTLSKLHKDMAARKRLIEGKLQSLEKQDFDVDSYLSVLEKAREKRDIQKSKYNIADGMRQMFDPFERVARAHHICPCCERPFSSEEEDEFVIKQRAKSASSAEHMKYLAADSSNADLHFQQLDKLRILFEEYLKIGKDSAPLSERSLTALKEDLDQKSQALDDVLGVLAQIKAEKDAVEVLLQPIEAAERLLQDIQDYHKQGDDLEYKLARGQGARSIEEVQLELNGLLAIKESHHGDLDKLRDEQVQMQKDLQRCQLRWHEVREEKVKVASMLDDFRRAEEDLERLFEEKTQLDLDEKHTTEALSPLAREKERLLSNHELLKSKLNSEYEQLTEQKGNFLRDVDGLLKVSSKIKEYNISRKGESLRELEGKRAQSECVLQSMNQKKKEIIAELDRSKDLMRNQDQLKRNIEDNLNYRKTKAEVDELTHDIEALEDNILKIGGFSTCESELAKLSQERDRLLSELNRCRGTMSVYQSNVSNNKVDLKQAQYKDIDRRYFDQLIQLKTSEMANKDLDRYYNALDKALMRFHTMKMEEINKIIRELWQQTYRGQDIDCIRIHSDSEGAGTRSYSYRVLMQTGDAELEMRGRCSAGQKVLASLIIRLALAETFCLHCGILALDEPTTNLDAPNAESLAAALLRIMDDRKGQENFQLIVITHDERFAQMIGQRQHAERYYRVSKDDLQHSIIEAQQIFD